MCFLSQLESVLTTRTQSQNRYVCLPTTSIFAPEEYRTLTQEQSASGSCQPWLIGQEVHKFSFRFISSSSRFLYPAGSSSHNGPSSRVSSLFGVCFVSEVAINRTVTAVLGAAYSVCKYCAGMVGTCNCTARSKVVYSCNCHMLFLDNSAITGHIQMNCMLQSSP